MVVAVGGMITQQTPQKQIVRISSDSQIMVVQVTVTDPKTKKNVIEISVDEWLEILSKLGYKMARVVEIPPIPQQSDPHLRSALENLDKAWKLMAENFVESLNAARKALEDIKEFAKKHGLIDANENIDFERIYGGKRFGGCMDSLFRALWCLTDVGSHTGRSKLTTRADMELVITSIYLLLKSMLEAVKTGYASNTTSITSIV